MSQCAYWPANQLQLALSLSANLLFLSFYPPPPFPTPSVTHNTPASHSDMTGSQGVTRETGDAGLDAEQEKKALQDISCVELRDAHGHSAATVP